LIVPVGGQLRLGGDSLFCGARVPQGMAQELVEVEEGATRLLVPAGHTVHGPAAKAKAAAVFYNRAAALNRDISVLYMAARHGGREVRALDALAGAGARGVRWVVEAGVRGVTLNDRSAAAGEAIRRNLARNDGQAEVLQDDVFLALARTGWQHVELDPYGSPAPFLDAAFRSLGRRGGVSFTATDAAALCGASARACERRYQAKPTRTAELCHEAALRILLAHAVREAAKHDQGVVPVLANSREHYFRCYVETRRSAHLADEQLARLKWLEECDACLHRGFAPERPRTCSACGGPARASGPMWSGPLWDPGLLQAMDKLRAGRALARPSAVQHDFALWLAEAEAGGLPFDIHRIAERERITENATTEEVVRVLQGQDQPAARCHLGGTLLRTPAPAREVVAAVRQAAVEHARATGSGRPAFAGNGESGRDEPS
jgi:tRNA (guanine26-N2/guanine27-N2)-dimethyltransferase